MGKDPSWSRREEREEDDVSDIRDDASESCLPGASLSCDIDGPTVLSSEIGIPKNSGEPDGLSRAKAFLLPGPTLKEDISREYIGRAGSESPFT